VTDESGLVVVVGEALVDLIARDGEPLTAVSGGSSYNTARAIARLGRPCIWIGGLSSDRFGKSLEAGLIADGVVVDLVQRSDLPTTLALAELGTGGAASYRFYVEGTAGSALVPGPLAGGLPSQTRALLVGSLGLVLQPMADTVVGLVSSLGPDVLLMLDPNARPSIIADVDDWRDRIGRVLARTDIVKASVEDLAVLRSGSTASEAAAWVESVGPRVVLVTDGPAPVLVRVAGAVYSVEAPSVRIVDTVGAGDTFAGAFLACVLEMGLGGDGLGDIDAVLTAARFAVRASSIVCGRVGADPPTLAELGGWPDRGVVAHA
jgi:fructokinase